jgi:sulfur dioxygenase
MMFQRQLLDPETSTWTYLLADRETGAAVLIDPVIEQVDRDLALLRELDLRLVWAVDTHVHADHITALGTLRQRTGCNTGISERSGNGCADVMLREGDRVTFGRHALEVRETPGHTSGCLSFVTDDHAAVFTGDALLIRACGRTDFQQGDARVLYRSVREKIFTLPDGTRVFPGHDYKGRTESTVGEEKRWNPRLGEARSEDEFVQIMSELKLAYPKKIDTALPANLLCGMPREATVSGETVARAWAPVEVTGAGVPEVTASWVAENLSVGRIVDVREVTEFNAELGHITGAELVPLSAVDDVVKHWDRDAPAVLVCRSGGRSGKAALAMLRLGFTRVVSMRGGMIAWNELRLPVARV